jgi:hypothetical protein
MANMETEASLRTHDIALIITEADSESHGVDHSDYSEHPVFRLLLLSPEDINDPTTIPRIQQLHRLDNGHNAALVFLLDHDKSQGSMQPFMELQLQQVPPHPANEPISPTANPLRPEPVTRANNISIRLTSNCTLPIIPLPTAIDLPATLRSFQTSLAASRDVRHWPVDPARDLLPFCSITSSPLSRRCVDALSAGLFTSFRELLEGIATEGQIGLREVLELETGEGEDGEVDRLIAFWKHEFATG